MHRKKINIWIVLALAEKIPLIYLQASIPVRFPGGSNMASQSEARCRPAIVAAFRPRSRIAFPVQSGRHGPGSARHHQPDVEKGGRLSMWLRIGCVGFLVVLAIPCRAETAAEAWKKQMFARLDANKLIPPEAMGQSRPAEVIFALDREGKLISDEIKQSSGSSALDSAALAMVERAQPFPAPPPAIIKGDRAKVVVVVYGVSQDAVFNSKVLSICRGC